MAWLTSSASQPCLRAESRTSTRVLYNKTGGLEPDPFALTVNAGSRQPVRGGGKRQPVIAPVEALAAGTTPGVPVHRRVSVVWFRCLGL